MKQLLHRPLLIIILFSFSLALKAQVAINTDGATANSSAMLDITSTNKGLLVPRVALQNSIDKTTIATPATSLLVWNTNAAMLKGVGFYFNNGTPASPDWQPIQDLVLPFYKGTSTNGSAFTVENFSQNTASTAIKAAAGGSGNALEVSGKMKISGSGQTPGQGKVLTSDASGNATWQGAIAFNGFGVPSTLAAQFGDNEIKKVPFRQKAYDLGGNFNDANTSPHSTFKAPVKGIYHFDIQVRWAYIGSGTFALYLQRATNGVATTVCLRSQIYEFYPTISMSIDLLLEVGQEVFVNAKQNTGSPQYIDGTESNTFFSGRLITKL